MPKVWKQRGLVPAEDSVAIPDVVFPQAARPAEAPAAVPEDDLPPDTEAGEPALSYAEPEAPAEPAAPVITPEELELYCGDELAALRQQAAEQGYRDAYGEAIGEIQQKLAQVDEVLSEMQGLQDQFIRKYSSTLKYTALEVAEKFVQQRIEADDAFLLRLVLQSVASVKNADWLTVEVSDRLEHLISLLREELAAPKYLGRVSVAPSAVPDDTCRVTSAEGTLDASISVQAENLRRVFDETDGG